MRQQTFVTYSVAGGGIFAYLDMDARDYQGRTRGSVKFYDQRYTGDASRGSQGEGFTVDGQFITSYYAEEFIREPASGLNMNGGVPSWALEYAQHRAVWQWIHLVYEGYGEQIPEYIAPLGHG